MSWASEEGYEVVLGIPEELEIIRDLLLGRGWEEIIHPRRWEVKGIVIAWTTSYRRCGYTDHGKWGKTSTVEQALGELEAGEDYTRRLRNLRTSRRIDI